MTYRRSVSSLLNQIVPITRKPNGCRSLTRCFSNDPNQIQFDGNPPSSINKEMAYGIQSATKMYVEHGIGKQKLIELGKETGDASTLVNRWQRMMEAFLSTQVHVIAGLGYTPNEIGLRK